MSKSKPKISLAEDYSGKGKILIVDNYPKKNSESIQHVHSAVEEAGYDPVVMRHSEARKLLKKEVDFADGYQGIVSSGSAKSWNKTGVKSKTGKEYLQNNDLIHDHLAKSDKPVYAICGGAHGIAQALGYNIVDTGEYNRGVREDGNMYNHKYGIENKKSLVGRVETIEHKGEKIVKSISHNNKFAAQYHPEKSISGRKELGKFFDRYLKPDNYMKAA